MLQQTQVDRVIPKYKAFLKQFPTAKALANAPLSEVLALWSGLGYNRRALYLKRTAEAIVSDFEGKFPKDIQILESLPGIGPYTARAVSTFAFGALNIFIETNIRRVLIHEFFPSSEKVADDHLIPYLAAWPLSKDVREWYWALMDYGSYLKVAVPNPNRRSKHYTKQSKFDGSLRQIRGALLRRCTASAISKKELLTPYKKEDRVRAERAFDGLVRDGFLRLDQKCMIKIKN